MAEIADLGFAVDDGRVWISGIGHDLAAPGAGVVAWTLRPPAGGLPGAGAWPGSSHLTESEREGSNLRGLSGV